MYYLAGTMNSRTVLSREELSRRFSSRTNRDLGRTPPLPSESTGAFPGSEEKLRIMEDRFSRGEQVFHPQDVRLRHRTSLRIGNIRECRVRGRRVEIFGE